MTTLTCPRSHLPLDILQNAARARRTVELGYGHISATAISRLRPYLGYGHISATAIRRGETVCPAHVGMNRPA